MENTDFNRGAIRPIQCLNDACELLKGQYGSILGVMIVGFLIVILGACIPLAPLTPPMLCGIYLCIFAMMRREQFNSSTLFKGFEHFGPSFLASLVLTVPGFVLSIVMQVGIGGFSTIGEAITEGENPSTAEAITILITFAGFIGAILLLMIIVSLVLGTLMSFTYPLIVDRKLGAIEAVKLSFRAVLGNLFGVIGLMILGQMLIIAGAMLFYVGALFVAPVVFVAWGVAYSRVFNLQVSAPDPQFGEPPRQAVWSPPVSASKAGWILTMSALLIFGLGAVGLAAVGFYSYHAISGAIEKAERENKQSEIFSQPSPTPYDIPSTVTPSTTEEQPTSDVISGGVINGKATDLPKPKYPASARAVNASGMVVVRVTVDEKGKVTSAEAVSGHPLLRAAAVEAARNAKFAPTVLSGKPVKVSGVLTYNFKSE